MAERFREVVDQAPKESAIKRGPPTAPSERLDDASLRHRYISQQSFATRAMSFGTQDLLVLLGSFAMALFALNLYKLTKPANG